MKKILSVLFCTVLFFCIFCIGMLYYLNQPVSNSFANEMVLAVNPGDSLFKTSGLLEDNSIIRSARFVRLYTKFNKSKALIKTGSYKLDSSMTSLQILDVLVEGKQDLVKITIAEGLTASKIAVLLEEKDICTELEFLSVIKSDIFLDKWKIPAESAEGYLLPDTYFFQKDYPAVKVADFLVKSFYDYFNAMNKDFELNKKQIHEKVILASIVEREYRSKSEAALIASVFYNRLNRDMKLESCATVVYVITEVLGKNHPNRLFYDDLKIKDPHNTYYTKGLPSGPISNPGRVSLKASLYPEKSDYLFFVVNPDTKDKHTFTEHYSDHLEASLSYIKSNF